MSCSSDSEDELLVLLYLMNRKRVVRHPCSSLQNNYSRQPVKKVCHEEPQLMTLLMSDEDKFFKHFRVGVNDFQELRVLLKKDIMKADFPGASDVDRLGIALSYLTSGDSFDAIGKLHRRQPKTVRKITKEVCKAVCKRLMIPIVTEKMLCQSARRFDDTQLFPHCVGALCSKHVLMHSSKRDDCYLNYADKSAVILLILADARHCLLSAEVLRPNSESDDVILEELKSGNLLLLNSVMPEPKFEAGMFLPPVMVANETFPLGKYLMTPYPKEEAETCPSRKLYNDRLSRVSQVAESTLGLIVQRFQVLNKPLDVKSKRGVVLLRAVCCLHNFFRLRDIERTGGKFREEAAQWAVNQSTAFLNMKQFGSEASHTAQGVRDNFARHFVNVSVGSRLFVAT